MSAAAVIRPSWSASRAAKIREGSSILGVARWLDESGVRATRGSAWTPQSIKRYLTNPRLAGWSTLRGEIVAEGRWEPILDRDTFEIVCALLTARTDEQKIYVIRENMLELIERHSDLAHGAHQAQAIDVGADQDMLAVVEQQRGSADFAHGGQVVVEQRCVAGCRKLAREA